MSNKHAIMAVLGLTAVALLFMALLAPVALGLATLSSLGGGGTETDAPLPEGDFSGDCKAKGLAFGMPTTEQADREAVFGKADGKTNIVEGTFFDEPVQMHEKVMPCLKAVEKELKAHNTSYKVTEPIASLRWPPDSLGWFHPYGAAVDINPSKNPQCACETHDIPDEWAKVFKKYGFFWGGNFRTTKDWMHFEWHGEAP